MTDSILKNKNHADLDREHNALVLSLNVAISKHLLNDTFDLIWANENYYQMIGCNKEEFTFGCVNQNYLEDLYVEYSKIYTALINAINDKQPVCEKICHLPHKDGSYVWVHFVGSFTNETVNGIQVINAVFTDISELMQTQLEQSLTYDNLPGFVSKIRIMKDMKFEYIYANDKFINFFGEQFINSDKSSIHNIDNEHNREVMRENYPMMLKGQPVKFVVEVQDKDGNAAWLQINADCINWICDDPVYLFIYIDITDITEQKKLQQILEERSEMLIYALAMAENANQAKSDFLSRMSHDIRTPMNAVLGMLAIAKESNNPDKISDCLVKIENSAKFLLTLINDILDMSKIESGKMELKKKNIDFVSVIKDVAVMFYSQAQKMKLNFNITVDTELEDEYIGDELKLNQIIINLIGNAMKFTDSGGSVEMHVSKGKSSEKATELIFDIVDTGIGIDDSFMEKLFVTFEQDTQQRENRGGSGLGLAIAKNYAKMMNGTIEVSSQLGKGSTFTVHVWLDNVENTKDTQSMRDSFKNMKALIVDSDSGSGKYTKSLLSKVCIDTVLVSSGHEAMKLIESAEENGSPFRALIIDLKLPNKDGIELTKMIRSKYNADKIIIGIASYDCTSIMDEASAAGVNQFLQKPLFSSNVYNFLVLTTKNKPIKLELSDKEDCFAGERILLAEDNDINLEIAQTLLESRNLLVECARNGKEALEMFMSHEKEYYFAVLMDIQMPIMNGLDTTKAIRALDRNDAKTVPIIAMSANAFDDDIEKSLESGMNAHISKPIDIPLLFKTLSDIKWKGKFSPIK